MTKTQEKEIPEVEMIEMVTQNDKVKDEIVIARVQKLQQHKRDSWNTWLKQEINMGEKNETA